MWFRVASVGCCLLLSLGPAALAQSTPGPVPPSAPLIVNVIATDKHNSAPATALAQGDFEILDRHGGPLPIVSFTPAAGTAKPLVVWLIVQCPIAGEGYNWKMSGSGFLAGKTDRLKPAIEGLPAQDLVGVAHWCNKQSAFAVDLYPTANRNQPTDALQAVLHMPPVELKSSASGRAGGGRRGGGGGDAPMAPGTVDNSALPGLAASLGDITRLMSPGSIPVLVFLYGDQPGADRDLVHDTLQRLYRDSAVVALLNDGSVTLEPVRSDDFHLLKEYLLHYLVQKTGGEAREASHGEYARELNRIVAGVRGAYQIGFTPPALDDRQHDLQIRLSREAARRLHSVSLRFPAAYVAVGPEKPSAGARMEVGLIEALRSPASYLQIHLDVTGRMAPSPAGENRTRTAQCRIYVDPKVLEWRRLVKGPLTAHLGLAVAGLSAAGDILSTQSTTLETAQPENASSSDKQQAVVFAVALPLNDAATHYRFVMRDAESGRVGSFDLPSSRIEGLAGGVPSTAQHASN